MRDTRGGKCGALRPVLAAFLLASAVATASALHAESPLASDIPDDATADQQDPRLLLRVIHDQDAVRYRRIFNLQEKGYWRSADKEIKKLRDRVLMGHVLAQRYLHPTKYRSRYNELERWLRHYADHPEAKRIYRLALRRKGKSSRSPRPPVTPEQQIGGFSSTGPTYGYTSPRRRSAATQRKVNQRIRGIRRSARAGRLTRARQLLGWRSTRRLLDPTELAIARSHVAAAYFFRGSPEIAYTLSSRSAKRAGPYMTTAYWIAGLSAYRAGAYREAATHLAAMAKKPSLSPWLASAAAFWAGRADLQAGRPDRYGLWLGKAAEYRYTFYGQLAARILGRDPGFDWEVPKLTPGHVDAVLTHDAGRRAVALLQVGADDRAERELVVLASVRDRYLAEALGALAEIKGLALLAVRTTRMIDEGDGPQPPPAARYPVPRWEPDGGFTVDRALAYAFMRQESRFNPRAKSHAGAMGLMQLMPPTAGFMTGTRFTGSTRLKLYDPGLNMRISQRYIRYLHGHQTVKGNVLMLAAAYNGGPGNLSKWRRRAKRLKTLSDPLLFIETIPARETRIYVERVVANLWVYRSRLGQDAPTLDRLAANEVPVYTALDGRSGAVARNARN